MAAIFSQILNMSMTGSVVILLVMLVRLILKRSPKIFSYALWSVVLFRLLCPVAFTAPISVLDVVEPEQKETSNNTSIVTYIPATVNTQADFIMVQPDEQQVQAESITEPEEQIQMTPMHAVALVWSAGMTGMMLYSVVEYLGLRRRLVGSVQLKGNIYLADHIDTAFVVGLLQPIIYLPSSVPYKERFFILAHEQHHIRRGDHIIKLLAYLALCIHWFNPLVWLAFVLAGKDMEMSCDEAVIKRLGPDIRADYSASLLRLATHKKILSGMPLAFGEGDTKGRVLNMAKWKKPTKWVVAICVILCLCVVIVCAFNPEEEIPIEELTRHTSEGPVDTAIGDLCFTYPGGLTSEVRDVDNWSEEDTTRNRRDLPTRRPHNHFFIDNGVDFGGVVDFIVPDDREIILEEMNLPTDWVGLDYIAGSTSYPYAEMEYTMIKDGKDYIQLYQYTYSGRGYFLWFYTEQGNPAHKEAILNSVELGSFSTTTTKLKRDEIISLGQFNITILKGYGYHRQEDKIIEITRKERFGEQVVVGCVTARPNPNLPLETDSDWVQWVEAVGLDLHRDDPNYRYTKSITGSGEFGDISLTLEEVVDKKLLMSKRHYFYIAGDIVYHLWFDSMEMNWTDDKQMLESIWIKEGHDTPSEYRSKITVDTPQLMEEMERYMPTVSASDENLMITEPVVVTEQEALAKCRAVLETIHSGSYKILSRRINDGYENPKGYEQSYSHSNEDWLNIINVLKDGERASDDPDAAITKSSMYVNGKRFTSTGREWVEIPGGEDTLLPWLAEFVWDENTISYIATPPKECGEMVMLRVDEKYVASDDADHYFVFFDFDEEGKFQTAEVQVNLLLDTDFTLTESILSLDQETVNAEIQKEYRHAVG